MAKESDLCLIWRAANIMRRQEGHPELDYSAARNLLQKVRDEQERDTVEAVGAKARLAEMDRRPRRHILVKRSLENSQAVLYIVCRRNHR